MVSAGTGVRTQSFQLYVRYFNYCATEVCAAFKIDEHKMFTMRVLNVMQD